MTQPLYIYRHAMVPVEIAPYVACLNAMAQAIGLLPVQEHEEDAIREAVLGCFKVLNSDPNKSILPLKGQNYSITWDPCWAAVDAFYTTRGIPSLRTFVRRN